MGNIIKTEGIVLSKINYGDSSIIARLFTKKEGKISVIVKGGRKPKSKIGKLINPLNTLEIIYYKKISREIQLLSDASLIRFHSNIQNNFNSMIFALSVLELTEKLIHVEEANERLFAGIEKILLLMDSQPDYSKIFFVKFLFFFTEILGYKFSFEKCSACNRALKNEKEIAFNYEKGFLCKACSTNEIINFSLTTEQYKKMLCLTSRQINCKTDDKYLNKLISVVEKYLDFQIEEFNGIKTLKLISNLEE